MTKVSGCRRVEKKAAFFTKLFEKSFTKNFLMFHRQAFQTAPGEPAMAFRLLPILARLD
ncbi:hypothetical protein LV564_14810 [Komagataeibacter nataicola]|uniref:hypothetical protein n=1 Tax=Komagataeibacter nataicola TaxID=265960 RepID=UPI0014289ACE|nr:hypothetical protein [Komagataeibacter nataicola]WEQ55342.1 hypothetical protein LV564_14810 [Komagataeibacter nataicola]